MRQLSSFTAVAIVTTIGFSLFCKAQPGTLDTTFNQTDQGHGYGDWFTGGLGSIAVQPDNKILVAGGFLSTHGTITHRVARLNEDGTVDLTFDIGVGPNMSPSVVLPLANGNIMVGGCFDSFSGNLRGHIACVSNNGDYLPSQNIGSGADNSDWVFTVAEQPDGKQIIGGNLSYVNGVSVNGIARLNADGSLDPTFDAGTGGYVRKAIIQNDGKILAFGNFQQFGGVVANQIIRLNDNGTVDPTFNIGSGSNQNQPITDLVLQDDGKVILAGKFTVFNGVARDGIVRLSQDGSIDLSFDPDMGVEYIPKRLAIRDDGKIVVSSAYVQADQIERFRITLLNQNGTFDAQFNTDFNISGVVESLVNQADGKILVGGYNFGGIPLLGYTPRRGLLRFNTDGTIDASFVSGTGSNGPVNSIQSLPDGGYLLSGSFTNYFGSFVNNIIRVNSTGSEDAQFVSGDWTYGSISCSAFTPEGKIIVGGLFNQQSPTERTSVVQMHENGALDASFNQSIDANGNVRDLQVLPDGDIIIVGEFDTINGIRKPHIARLNMDGTLDGSFLAEQGVNGNVHTCAIQPDGKIVIGGSFYANNGITTGRVVRLNADGSTDGTFNTLFGADTDVNSIAIQPDGKVILVGNFTMYGGVILNKIVRLNSDATMDMTFNTGTGANNQITDVLVQPDGKIVIVGLFTTFNGVSKNRICRLLPDGSIDDEFIGTGTDYQINTVVLDQNGDIMIGGHFGEYDGIGRNRIARLHNDLNLSFEEESYTTAKPVIIPNPAGESFKITDLNSSVRLELIDQNGRMLFVSDNYSGQSIDVGHISPGVYVVHIRSSHAVSNVKLIIQ